MGIQLKKIQNILLHDAAELCKNIMAAEKKSVICYAVTAQRRNIY
jgi:hypothetical protein